MTHPLRPTTLLRLAAGLLTVLSASALAQSYGFAPTVILMDSQQSLNTQTTMYNTGTLPAKFSVEVKAWRMQDGQNILEDTRDLIVNPTQFTIPPGKQQVVRIGLRKKPGPDELTYRIVVRQDDLPGSMPQQNVQIEGRGAVINMALAFSLPVYIAPENAAAKVQYAATSDGKNISLNIANTGNRHETFNALRAERGGQSVSVDSFAVLRGATYTALLPNLGSASGPLTLRFTNARGVTVSETINF